MYKVCIFMSTYNGEKYIREQLDSLMAQKGVDLRIVVRDDGSTDKTCNIISEEYPSIELRREKNIGCEPSFMDLLYSAPDADFYAFCDQDDVWMENKLESAVNQLVSLDGPAIYGCNLTACDEQLKPMRIIHDERGIQVAKLRAENDCIFNLHGCVLVWNRSLQKIIELYQPNYVAAHDTWVNSVGIAVGTMFIDQESHIYYRLHNNNASGLAKSKMERIKKGFVRYFGKRRPHRDLIAKEILEGYSEHLDKNSNRYQELNKLAGYKKNLKTRMTLMNSPMIMVRNNPDRLFWKLCILFGKY